MEPGSSEQTASALDCRASLQPTTRFYLSRRLFCLFVCLTIVDAVTNHGRLGGSKQQMYSRTALEIRSLALRLSTGSCYLQRLGGIHSSLLPGSLRCPWLEAYPVVSPVFISPPPLCTLVSSRGLNRSTNANPVRAKPRVQVASPVCMELVLGEDPSSHFLSSCC